MNLFMVLLRENCKNFKEWSLYYLSGKLAAPLDYLHSDIFSFYPVQTSAISVCAHISLSLAVHLPKSLSSDAVYCAVYIKLNIFNTVKFSWDR